MPDYWIKWYHEIIDDPKMATLPDRIWRRFTELCLLAGRLCQDKSGKLPDTRQLAWMLRMSTDDLQLDLDQLVSTGLLESIPNGWFIPNFEKRQKASTVSERVEQHRKRKQHEQYNDDVTKLKRNVTQINRNRLTETESETDIQAAPPNPSEEIRKIIKVLWTDHKQPDQVDILIERYGIEQVKDMAEWCAKQNMSSMRQAINSMNTMGPKWKSEKKTKTPLTSSLDALDAYMAKITPQEEVIDVN